MKRRKQPRAATLGYCVGIAVVVAVGLACQHRSVEEPPCGPAIETPAAAGDDLYATHRNEAWPEIPARLATDTRYVRTADVCYITHMGQLDGAPVRNYTMCFDRSKRGAWWVAYPLAEGYTGSERRPDRWAYDPEIGEEWQAALVDYSYPAKEYDRGHQIPNGDRNGDAAMQAQTFYCSNATPQTATLNGGSWAKLEERIRRSWMCADTLYVVTGAVWESGSTTTPDRAGRDCPVPDYYFKVLLRTRRGNIRTAGDRLGDYDAARLKAIGFWVRNDGEQGSFKEWTASVAEIERRTGFEFFPTVPAGVKEQYDKTDWGL